MTDWVDAWARLVAQRVSRRQLLGGMGAITAGSALGVLTPAAAAGSVTRRGTQVDKGPLAARSCPSGYVPCGKICCDPDGQCLAAPNGVLVCSNACGGNAHFQVCLGVCQDVYYDPGNCGWCGNQCPPPPPNSKGKATGVAVCNSGTCGCSCGKGLRECVDDNGRCVCISGSCPCTAANCKSPNTCCGGVCTDTIFDPANCGSCGHACQCGPGFTATCVNGTCSCQCLSPNTPCPGPNGTVCVNTSYDLNNCGACGNVCSSHCTPQPGFTTTCDSGQCANYEVIVQFC